ncbi:MAG: hypothetical protein QNJ87_15155 [Gammaproteobacteria bacterium]|nr:hypothetical protein [Gammaproteobacteria bacterium]
MLYRVLFGIGLVALGYYIGRQVGRAEGQLAVDMESLQGNPLGESRSPDPGD